MTSQVLFRTDSKLKEAFQSKAKAQGVSMDFILNTFVRTYVDKPDIVQTYIDDDAFDDIIRRSFATPEAKKASVSLHKAMKAA
jgi:antitoxin component of RelBE/YafQ-DinJ toxin-antitoxin module